MGTRATPASDGGHRPPDGHALLGPLLTEREFARRAGLTGKSVRRHRCVPRIDSAIGLGAAYPAFMLDENGLRFDVALVTLLLRRRVGDLQACDWLVRRNPRLADRAPLDWIGDGLSLERVVDALPTPSAASRERLRAAEVDAIREEWLRFEGDEVTPGWTIAWERVSGASIAAPHGV